MFKSGNCSIYFQVRDDRRKQSDVSEEGGTSSESPPRDIISDQVNYFAKIAYFFFWNFGIFFSFSGIPQNNSDQNVLSSTPDPDWFTYAANDISLFPHADRHDL